MDILLVVVFGFSFDAYLTAIGQKGLPVIERMGIFVDASFTDKVIRYSSITTICVGIILLFLNWGALLIISCLIIGLLVLRIPFPIIITVLLLSLFKEK